MPFQKHFPPEHKRFTKRKQNKVIVSCKIKIKIKVFLNIHKNMEDEIDTKKMEVVKSKWSRGERGSEVEESGRDEYELFPCWLWRESSHSSTDISSPWHRPSILHFLLSFFFFFCTDGDDRSNRGGERRWWEMKRGKEGDNRKGRERRGEEMKGGKWKGEARAVKVRPGHMKKRGGRGQKKE